MFWNVAFLKNTQKVFLGIPIGSRESAHCKHGVGGFWCIIFIKNPWSKSYSIVPVSDWTFADSKISESETESRSQQISSSTRPVAFLASLFRSQLWQRHIRSKVKRRRFVNPNLWDELDLVWEFCSFDNSWLNVRDFFPSGAQSTLVQGCTTTTAQTICIKESHNCHSWHFHCTHKSIS